MLYALIALSIFCNLASRDASLKDARSIGACYERSCEPKPTPTPTPKTHPPCPPHINCGDPGGAGQTSAEPNAMPLPGSINPYDRAGAADAVPAKARGESEPMVYRLLRVRHRTASRAEYGRSTGVVKRRGCDPTAQEQTDLSGSYLGNVNYPAGRLLGPAALTIAGNDFALTSGEKKLTGQLVVETTCSYTAVALRLNSSEPAADAGTPRDISLRAVRSRDKLWLTAVTAEPNQFTFTPGGRKRTRSWKRRI